jgi:hypothetical protein
VKQFQGRKVKVSSQHWFGKREDLILLTLSHIVAAESGECRTEDGLARLITFCSCCRRDSGKWKKLLWFCSVENRNAGVRLEQIGVRDPSRAMDARATEPGRASEHKFQNERSYPRRINIIPPTSSVSYGRASLSRCGLRPSGPDLSRSPHGLFAALYFAATTWLQCAVFVFMHCFS